MPTAGRLQPSGVGSLVDGQDNCLCLDGHSPMLCLVPNERALGLAGYGGYAVHAGRPVSVGDDGVAGLEILAGIAWPCARARINELIVAHDVFFEIHRLAVDPEP